MDYKCSFPVSETRWEALLRESPDATVFQTPGWTKVLSETYGYRPAARLFETSDGEVLVPMVEMRRFGMNALSSIPLGYGGPVTPGHPVGRLGELLGALVGGRTLRLYLSLPPRLGTERTPMAMAGFEEYVSDWNYCHVLDLAGGPEAVLQRASRSIRRNIAACERMNVEVTADNSSDGLQDFYKLFAAQSRSWGYTTPPYPFRLYEAIMRHLGQNTQLLIARRAGEIIGGQLLLLRGDVPLAWSLVALNNMRGCHPSAMLIHEAVTEAYEAGASYLNLGGSGQLTGVREYKEHWGAGICDVPRFIRRSRLDRLVVRPAPRRPPRSETRPNMTRSTTNRQG